MQSLRIVETLDPVNQVETCLRRELANEGFRSEVCRAWRHALLRRSQRHRLPWDRYNRLARRFIPLFSANIRSRLDWPRGAAFAELWHDRSVIVFVQIILRLLADLAGLVVLSVRARRSVEAENLFLRRELALYQERGAKPRRVDAATRASLAILCRMFDWRDALVVVRPETLIRWHRVGWRLFWRRKSRPGRPRIPLELRQLIRRMATENPLWGEERIANELLLKLGLRVSPRTIRKYMPKRPPGRPRGDQRWSTFLRNHAQEIVACDFFVSVTVTFRLFYVLVLIEHGSRRLLHFNVTQHPSAEWTLQQLREALGHGDFRYLIHDRDSIFAGNLDESIKNLGMTVLKSPPYSPKANAICERVIGTI
jgi:putative transposase